MSKPMTVRFWGVRGSHPVPGENTLHYGGNTSCVELRANDQTIILDAGTGIIPLGKHMATQSRESGAPVRAVLLFSHLHQDHLQGFPFFAPAYMPFARLFMFGPEALGDGVEEALTRLMTPPAFPVPFRETRASKWIRALQEDDIIWVGDSIGGTAVRKSYEISLGKEAVSIRVLRSFAHPGGVLIYRIEWEGQVVVYATDTEGYVGADRRLVNFARGASVLIHDAQYTEEHYRGQSPGLPSVQGYGHSTVSMACEVAQAASVERLVLFHHDPGYEDAAIARMEAKARQCFPNTVAAYEGLEITLEGDTRLSRKVSQPISHLPNGVIKTAIEKVQPFAGSSG